MAMKMEMGVVKGVGYREWMHGETRERGLSLQHKPSPIPSLSNLIPANPLFLFFPQPKRKKFFYQCTLAVLRCCIKRVSGIGRGCRTM